MSAVILRPLRENDLDMLAAWLNEPHLKPYYMGEATTPKATIEKFLPRTREGHAVRSLVAETGGMPFGYLQWYFNRSFPEDSAAAAGETDGVSLDYYIGRPDFLGRRLGAAMLTAVRHELDKTLRYPDRHIFIQHNDGNQSARRCTQVAGFLPVKQFTRCGLSHSLYHAPPIEADALESNSRNRRTA